MDFYIDRTGARGDGVALSPDGLVYVPGALPGERVSIGKIRKVGGSIRAVSPQILETSLDRVLPSCNHFEACGGCVAQHMSAVLYGDWKRGLVRKALNRAGVQAEILESVMVPPGKRRRLRLAFRALRGGTLLGFREARSSRIVPVFECPVATTGIVAALPALKRLLPRFAKSGDVTVTETLAGLDVVVFAKEEPDPDLRMDVPEFCDEAGVCRLSWSDGMGAPEPILVVSCPQVLFGDVAVSIPPNSFLQPTEPGEKLLQDFVLDETLNSPAVADLYAGCGTFSLPLAAAGKSVHAVESVSAQSGALRAAGGNRGVTVETRDLVRQPLHPSELIRFDAVVLNPPRAGAAPQVERLIAISSPLIVYVSCNPATFARDAKTLIDGGYAIGPVQPVDQFLWSHHIELAAAFRPVEC